MLNKIAAIANLGTRGGIYEAAVTNIKANGGRAAVNATARAQRHMVAATSYLTSINNLKVVLLACAAAIGVCVLVYGGIRFALSFQKMDQQGEHAAIYTVAGGGILIGISALVTALT